MIISDSSGQRIAECRFGVVERPRNFVPPLLSIIGSDKKKKAYVEEN